MNLCVGTSYCQETTGAGREMFSLRTSPATPTTSNTDHSRFVQLISTLIFFPSESSSGQACRAIAVLTIASPAPDCVSSRVKFRPRTMGMPSVLKYVGETCLASVSDGAMPGAALVFRTATCVVQVAVKGT